MVINAYNCAILIIGSLFWDTKKVRIKWRNERLDLNNKSYVKAPIRYGRLSSSRGSTYTMVFSQLCYRNDYGEGTAILAPCRKEVRNFNDLKQEAQELWLAEGGLAKRISGSWGTVGILINPQINISEDISKGWQDFYRGQEVKFEPVQTKTETPIIDDDGFLNLGWPKLISTNLPVDVDFILATATQPTIDNERYPEVRRIANAWLESNPKYKEYFTKNSENNITTFQDEKINKYLNVQK